MLLGRVRGAGRCLGCRQLVPEIELLKAGLATALVKLRPQHGKVSRALASSRVVSQLLALGEAVHKVTLEPANLLQGEGSGAVILELRLLLQRLPSST
eukprot:4656625-Amphidinium_carterae.3